MLVFLDVLQWFQLILGNFRLDTRSINQLFHHLPGPMHQCTGKYEEYGRQIWNSFIKLEGTSQEKANCFKNTEKHYQFKNSIVTDGYSCSVTLIRKDLVEKDYTTTQLSHTEPYLEDLSEERIKELQEKRSKEEKMDLSESDFDPIDNKAKSGSRYNLFVFNNL
ncbi:hypothetical protein RCL1_003598 [Eukaryota sp. TZLM3-RCL]